MASERTATEEDELVQSWRAEAAREVQGWDFSHLYGRMDSDDPPWDFDAMTRAALASSTRVLDMGTGGGEQLLTFLDVLPAQTVATEGWAPNIEVARAALAPHGIEVVAYGPEAADPRARRIPLPDNHFDLVLNRHEASMPQRCTGYSLPVGCS
jgi:hypothetical protein